MAAPCTKSIRPRTWPFESSWEFQPLPTWSGLRERIRPAQVLLDRIPCSYLLLLVGSNPEEAYHNFLTEASVQVGSPRGPNEQVYLKNKHFPKKMLAERERIERSSTRST